MAGLSRDDAPGLRGNHRFILGWLMEQTDGRPARVLDFGCGAGELVAAVRCLDLPWTLTGADVVDGPLADLQLAADASLRQSFLPIVDHTLPCPDDSFDIVVTNMVIEHIADPPPSLAEIARVLKPGGLFLALFPTRDTWYEGHLGLWFAHWLAAAPAVQRRYMALCHRLGFGYHRQGEPATVWAAKNQEAWAATCFYHGYDDCVAWWRSAFGTSPRSLAAEYFTDRLRHHPRTRRWVPLATLLPRQILAFLCHIRATRVVLVRNDKTTDRPP